MILLVDDQQSVVEGLLAGVNWVNLGNPQVVTANSAMRAKELFALHNIDIIVCDIEMPVENGLSLFTWVRENYPVTQGIFLTSHAVFDYAQTALRLGSFEYLVQPIDYMEFESCLKKLIDQIYIEQQGQSLSQIGSAVIERRENFIRHFWTNLILTENKKRLDKIEEDILLLGIPVDIKEKYIPVLLTVKDEHVSLGRWDTNSAVNNISALFTKCSEIAGEINHSFFVQMNDSHLLVIVRDQAREALFATLRMWHDACRQSLSIHCRIYVGRARYLNALDDEYRKIHAYRQSGASDDDIVSIEMIQPSEKMLQDVEHLISAFTGHDRWIRLFSHGDEEKLKNAFDKDITVIHKQKQEAAGPCYLLYQQITSAFFSSLAMRNVKEQDIYKNGDYLTLLVRARNSTADLRAWFDALICFNRTLPVVQGSTEHALVNKLKEYINNNLDQNLTRKELASQIYLSESYVSHLFTKETGEPLADYIANCKIELAKQLLSSNAYPVSVVAMKAGYSNFSYFSKLFKKKTGLTPNEYRKNMHI